MVPIIEPEILNDGEHGINRALEVHEEVLSILFRTLQEHHVYLEGMVLKVAMVLSGIKNTANCTPQVNDETSFDSYAIPRHRHSVRRTQRFKAITWLLQLIAEHTLTALQRTVPPAVPVITFLSGGQSDSDSVINLNAICAYEGTKPWPLTFCYGRALQLAAMQAWKGNQENVPEAQAVFLERARVCSEAALGQMEPENGVCTRKKTNSR